MQPETHERADQLIKEINEAKIRLNVFNMVRKHCVDYPKSRVLEIDSMGAKISLPGEFMSEFSDKIGDFLKSELKQLEKEYKEL